MRLRLTTKLATVMGATMLAGATVLLVLDYIAQRKDDYVQAERLVTTIAQHQAARFEAALGQVAQIARSTAAMAQEHSDLTEEELYAICRSNVLQSPLVYGSCIAFAPDGFETGRARFAPYVYGGQTRLARMDIAGAYDYTEGWEWWTLPVERGAGVWTEPYFDEGAGGVLMCTYSAPFYNDRGELRGVATVDVHLMDFQKGVVTDGEVPLEFSVITRRGHFISDPDPYRILRESIFSIAERTGDRSLLEMGRRLVAGETGTARIVHSATGKAVLTGFAPIASTSWSFVISIPESSITADVVTNLVVRTILVGLGTLLMIALCLTLGVWMTKPVAQLAQAVKALGVGGLETRPLTVKSSDEIADLARAFNAMVDRLRAHVAALTSETQAREAVESELRVARDIQTSLLPQPLAPSALFDVCARSIPARHVGGDFADYFHVSRDKIVIAIGDVSGKGVPAAILMAGALTLVRNLASKGASPAEVLTEVNAELLKNNQYSMFVTLWLGVYDTTTGEMVYANAGHLPPVLISPSAAPALVARATGTVLGVMDHLDIVDSALHVGPGHAMVLYTDGVTEARNAQGVMFRDTRLMAMLAEWSGWSSAEVCDHVTGQVIAYQENNPWDDVTVLTLVRR